MKKTLLMICLALVIIASSASCIEHEISPVDPNVFSVSSLPDIGEFSGKSSGGRFYDEITYDFIPSDEYGTIVPYVASYRLFETPKEEGSEWHTEQGYASYGFCTPDGKIVMDASDKNTYINFRQLDDGFGFYTVTREAKPKDDAPDEFTPSETLVIPVDGSWCLTLDARSWVTTAGEGVICICSYAGEAANAGVRTLMYDYDGNLVRTLDGIDSTGAYSNGLMLVSNWVSSGYSAYFVNDDGEKVLGPYSMASDFTKYGLTAVEDENGDYIINTSGERLTDYYDSFFKEYSADMSRQVFVGRRKDDKNVCDVYSETGDYLGSLEGSSYFSLRFPDNGEIYAYYTAINDDKYGSASDRMVWKRLSDGKDFVSKEFGVSPNSYSGTDNCFAYIDKEKNRAYVFDGDGKTIAVLDGATDIINTSEYGEYIAYTEGEFDYQGGSDNRITHLYNSAQKEIVYSTATGGASAYFADADKRFVVITQYDEADFFGGVAKYSLFDTESGVLKFENANDIRFFNVDRKTYINVCNENSAALYDGDLKPIIKRYFE